MKILYINNHVKKNFQKRINKLIDIIKTDNDDNKLKIMYGYQTINNKNFIKPILVLRDKWFLPLRVFEKNGIFHYKILSVLFETQFFTSLNLNFGIHTKPKNIRFNIIEEKEIFFDENFNDILKNKKFEDFEWIINFTEKEPDKTIQLEENIKKRKNKILKDIKSIPFKIETLRGKVIEIK